MKFAVSLLAGIAQPALIGMEERASREGAITSLSVKGAFEKDLVLQTRPLHSAMNVMRDCLANLHEGWGIPAAIQSATPVRQDRWALDILRDTSFRGLAQNEVFFVPVVVIVGTDQRAEQCIALPSPAPRDFARETCENIKRHARFNPARDANGEPIRGVWRTSISFQMD